MRQGAPCVIATQKGQSSPGRSSIATYRPLLRLYNMPMIVASFIAMSNRRTCWYAAMGTYSSAILVSPGWWNRARPALVFVDSLAHLLIWLLSRDRADHVRPATSM